MHFIGYTASLLVCMSLTCFGHSPSVALESRQNAELFSTFTEVAAAIQGEEAIIDCLLLSKWDYLIGSCSNLSQWATFF